VRSTPPPLILSRVAQYLGTDSDPFTNKSMTRKKSRSISTAEEEAWQDAVKDLQGQVVLYQGAKESGDTAQQRVAEQRVVEGMRRISDTHTDPKVRQEWKAKADEFERAGDAKKEHILKNLGKGLLILLATPFALAGAAIFAAGAMLYGVGCVIQGLGTILTAGSLRGRI
jgi:hypothetical protein